MIGQLGDDLVMDVHLHGVSCFLNVQLGVDEKVSRRRLHQLL